MSLMSPRNRRSFIPYRSTSSPPPLSPLSRQAKSATSSPVVTVRVAPSQPFSPFRSTIQEPSSTSQGSSSRHHGMPQSTSNSMNVSLPPGGKITSVPRGNDIHTGGNCVQQSETGDKIDPRRVLAVLQELSRSRKRTRERDRGKRLMGDCREHGGNVTGIHIISRVGRGIEQILKCGSVINWKKNQFAAIFGIISVQNI